MESEARSVPDWLDRAAAWSWRLLALSAAAFVVGRVLYEIRLVVLPVVVSGLLATVLVPLRRGFARLGLRPALAMLATVASVFVALTAVTALIVPPLIDEFTDLDATLEEAGDEVEDWLVTGPLGLDADFVADRRVDLEDAIDGFEASEGAVVDGAVLVGEVFAGLVLTIVVTFFVVKDGDRLVATVHRWVPERHRGRVDAVARAAWRSMGGYVRGAALLGAVESVIMAITLTVVGAGLVIPVATLTFVAAFFPFVGAIAAGVLATAVALVTASPSAAFAVAVVAVIVQQFDNDLLAPVIYGRALNLHPLTVVIGLASGAAAGGIVGAFLAVPLIAVVTGIGSGLRDDGVRADAGTEPPASGAEVSAD